MNTTSIKYHDRYTPTQWSVIVLSPINDACFVFLFFWFFLVFLLLFFVCLFLFCCCFLFVCFCFFYNVTLAYGHVYIDYIVSRRS